MMHKKIKWGILGTAKIGREKVIPAIQKSVCAEVYAIASRDGVLAQTTAAALHIPVAYSSYEALLADEKVQAVYVPLPNHLHVQWAIRCIQAGKHVLCEKPIGLSVAEAKQLQQAMQQYPSIKVMEAFMYRFHPQWQYAKALVKDGRIGELKIIQSFFSYYNINPDNIRNKVEAGGGALMDIGCYPVSLSRFLLEQQPARVMATMEHDPVMQTDRITTGTMDFGGVISQFVCATQLMPYQCVNLIGTDGRITLEMPFNPLPDHSYKVLLYAKNGNEEKVIPPIDQYTVQVDAFCESVIYNKPVPVSIGDAICNMEIIEALVNSSKTNSWINM